MVTYLVADSSPELCSFPLRRLHLCFTRFLLCIFLLFLEGLKLLLVLSLQLLV